MDGQDSAEVRLQSLADEFSETNGVHLAECWVERVMGALEWYGVPRDSHLREVLAVVRATFSPTEGDRRDYAWMSELLELPAGDVFELPPDRGSRRLAAQIVAHSDSLEFVGGESLLTYTGVRRKAVGDVQD